MLQKVERKKLAYWALVESYRTPQGPRQRIVAYLGQLKEPQRQGVKQAAERKNKPSFVQTKFFDGDQLEPEWVEINANGVRVENEKDFGGPWLALELVKLLGLDDFLKQEDRKFVIGTAKGELRNFERELLAEDWNTVR